MLALGALSTRGSLPHRSERLKLQAGPPPLEQVTSLSFSLPICQRAYCWLTQKGERLSGQESSRCPYRSSAQNTGLSFLLPKSRTSARRPGAPFVVPTIRSLPVDYHLTRQSSQLAAPDWAAPRQWHRSIQMNKRFWKGSARAMVGYWGGPSSSQLWPLPCVAFKSPGRGRNSPAQKQQARVEE